MASSNSTPKSKPNKPSPISKTPFSDPSKAGLPWNADAPLKPNHHESSIHNVNKLLIGLFVGLALGGTAVWLYQRGHPAPSAPTEEKKDEKKEVSFVQHSTNGETFLKLDKEAQLRVGLKTAALAAAQAKPEVQGYGRVLDPGPLAALLVEAASNKAALDASTREYDRLKILHAGQNASTRALETAEAA